MTRIERSIEIAAELPAGFLGELLDRLYVERGKPAQGRIFPAQPQGPH